eukprot:6414772-Ditylum_brightwellii.AAC.1
MLVQFPAPDNRLMADNKLCDILYQMVKHEWRKALRKSGCLSLDMIITNLFSYFEQIKLLDIIDMNKSETITVDDDSNKNDQKSKSSCSDNNTNTK